MLGNDRTLQHDPTASRGRLLILDDDPAVGMTIGLLARREGLDYRTTMMADDFFAELARWQPTHIALDLVMPEVDGIEILRRLGAIECQATIIITSGAGSRVLEAARRSALEHGLHIAGVAAKPFNSAGLRALFNTSPAGNEPRGSRRAPAAETRLDTSEAALRLALEQREFAVFYQPRVDCVTRQLSGLEALVRWQHPALGTVAPDRFIGAFERCELIDRLTEQVFTMALQWLGTALPDSEVMISLNLSARSLDDDDLADRMEQWCRQAAVAPRRVIVELTETAATNDPSKALDLLTRLRLKGFHLSIDDFGVGHSSLAQLARLPFSELKIDKSFVMTAGESRESQAICRGVIGLGHGLGLTVAAEGVEDESTLAFLADCGCDLAQGYLFARPMGGDDVLPWLARHLAGAPDPGTR